MPVRSVDKVEKFDIRILLLQCRVQRLVGIAGAVDHNQDFFLREGLFHHGAKGYLEKLRSVSGGNYDRKKWRTICYCHYRLITISVEAGNLATADRLQFIRCRPHAMS
jgi:hypothetical protein